MTEEEFEKICKILDQNTKDVWINPVHCKKYIPNENIPYIKKQIYELVKGGQNGKR